MTRRGWWAREDDWATRRARRCTKCSFFVILTYVVEATEMAHGTRRCDDGDAR